jgi:hypothetical protein
MPARLPVVLLSAGLIALAAGCGQGVDLARDLSVTDIETGYYNNGLKDGAHHLVPTVSFQLLNQSDHDISSVQLIVQFWKDGADDELDSRQLTGISTEALEPAAKTERFLVRSQAGFTLEDPDISTLFTHSLFTDVSVRVFARRSGGLVKIAEQTIERRILTQVRDPGHP